MVSDIFVLTHLYMFDHVRCTSVMHFCLQCHHKEVETCTLLLLWMNISDCPSDIVIEKLLCLSYNVFLIYRAIHFCLINYSANLYDIFEILLWIFLSEMREYSHMIIEMLMGPLNGFPPFCQFRMRPQDEEQNKLCGSIWSSSCRDMGFPSVFCEYYWLIKNLSWAWQSRTEVGGEH